MVKAGVTRCSQVQNQSLPYQLLTNVIEHQKSNHFLDFAKTISVYTNETKMDRVYIKH